MTGNEDSDQSHEKQVPSVVPVAVFESRFSICRATCNLQRPLLWFLGAGQPCSEFCQMRSYDRQEASQQQHDPLLGREFLT